MQVVILCGGLGTRLKEETEFRPKPMVVIGQRPILWHIMKIYAHHGFNDFVLTLGYRGEMIKDYFYNYELMSNSVTITLGHPNTLKVHKCHDEVGWQVTLVDTGDQAMKGARLKRVQRYIHGETFMLTYGDGVADIDINALLAFHKSHGKLATVTGVSPFARFGELRVRGNTVGMFTEKPENPTSKGWISGGFFVLNREIFDYLTDSDDCDLEYGVFEELARTGQLMVYKHRGFWACMDTLRDMDYLNKLWKEGAAKWKIWQA
ncbi:glucose-1-phosphate cytidylyltransferase [Candidatus Magnetomonas plexicatena]|uniref:glucose-1-phosphate cytidylyltransferase n=1 Tax=Candidatus Magnetomonas plexicatena TaxID=2552947 RepID=UPI001C77EC5A|nr:glucose-1-phosphate cytidylyltransferase [Nitrospirales bacterium LBB_01]